jgi:RDD family protein
VKQVFETSVGTVEVRIDHESRTIGVYRFDDRQHAAAAAIGSWEHVELTDVFNRQIVRIRVVDEHGEHPTLGAAAVRNILRPVDALFLDLVGAVFALMSPLGQRLGDRVAHTVVVRR